MKKQLIAIEIIYIAYGCHHLYGSTECIQADQIRCEPAVIIGPGKISNQGIQGQAG